MTEHNRDRDYEGSRWSQGEQGGSQWSPGSQHGQQQQG